MNSTPSELISTFRKKISLTSYLGIILCILGLVLLYILDLSGIIGENRTPILGIFSASIFFFWQRNYTYREILKGTPEEFVVKLETHLDEESNRSKKNHWTRIFILTALSLAWIILALTHPKSEWTSFLFILWLAGILFSIITHWLRMKEEFMLQDIKHSLREHHSEAS